MEATLPVEIRVLLVLIGLFAGAAGAALFHVGAGLILLGGGLVLIGERGI